MSRSENDNKSLLDSVQNAAILAGDLAISHGIMALWARGAMIRAKRRELGDDPDGNKPLDSNMTPAQVARSMAPLITMTMLPSLLLIAPRTLQGAAEIATGKPSSPSKTITHLPQALQQHEESLLEACNLLQQECNLDAEQTAVLHQALMLKHNSLKDIASLLEDSTLPPETRLREAAFVLGREAGLEGAETAAMADQLQQNWQAIQDAIKHDKQQSATNILMLALVGAGLCAANAMNEKWKDAVMHRSEALEAQQRFSGMSLGGGGLMAQVLGQPRGMASPEHFPSVRAQNPPAATTPAARDNSFLFRRAKAAVGTGLAELSMMLGITASNRLSVTPPQTPSAPPIETLTATQAQQLLTDYSSPAGEKLQELQKIGGSAADTVDYIPHDIQGYQRRAEILTGLPGDTLQQAKANVAVIAETIETRFSENAGLPDTATVGRILDAQHRDNNNNTTAAIQDTLHTLEDKAQEQDNAERWMTDYRALAAVRGDRDVAMPGMIQATEAALFDRATAVLEQGQGGEHGQTLMRFIGAALYSNRQLTDAQRERVVQGVLNNPHSGGERF